MAGWFKKQKWTKTQRAEIRSIVAALDRRGFTQREMVVLLAERHGYEMSQPMVGKYLKLVRDEYNSREVTDRHEMVQLRLEQYKEIRKEAWMAYDKSMLDAHSCEEHSQTVLVPAQMLDPDASATALASAERLKRIIVVAGRLPEDGYLSIILKTLEDENKLLGLYPDPKQANNVNQVNIDVGAILAEATRLAQQQGQVLQQPEPKIGLKEKVPEELSDADLLSKIMGDGRDE